MSDAQPPPIPSQVPPPAPTEPSQDRNQEAYKLIADKNQEAYNLIADKIGGLPNVRKKDNLYQALAIAAFTAIGSFIGLFKGGWPGGVIAGCVCGMVVGLLLSGAVLAVIGLARKL